MNYILKKCIPDGVAILFFILLSVGYFITPLQEGKELIQHDALSGAAVSHEAHGFHEKTGETTRWTNSLFGGMPTYQISPSYPSTNIVKQIQNLYNLYLPSPIQLIFMMLLGFYILLRAFGMCPILSALGAVMYAFSSYFFIIIQAGHIWKFITLAYIPPTIAGIVLAYNKKYLLGGIVTAFFLTMQILSNHMQMSYYFVFVILLMTIAYFVKALQQKEIPHFFKASAILVVAALVGICINLSTLYHTYEYTKQTMRGKSELQQNVENHTNNGLEKDYIVQWSYGIGETLSLLVPNVNGGASVPLANSEVAMKEATPQYKQFYQYYLQYFGDQPFTSGPVYVGAFVFALFVLGLFMVQGPMKWALLVATILSVLLSWGQNFMPFTDLFLDYVPMYNKFRAVSSILVVAEFTIPLLAMLCLFQIWKKPSLIKEEKIYVYLSIGLTAGISLLLAITPELLISKFSTETDENTTRMILTQMQIPENQHFSAILSSLERMRSALVTADAWRSFCIILIGFGLLLSIHYFKEKGGKLFGLEVKTCLMVAIILLCVGDMWNVNKRYLNDSHFETKQKSKDAFKPTVADLEILKDEDPNFRVLNFTTSTFNDAITSYYHKSVGGYHAAKLRRYQDLINNYIEPEMTDFISAFAKAGAKMDSVDADRFKVINMLNTKYFILGTRSKQTIPLQNPYAYGNAWFVRQINYVSTPDEEIGLLQQADLKETAVVDKQFKEKIQGSELAFDSASNIQLIEYRPNHLVYQSKSAKNGIAVFSEVYYPGWRSYLDGMEVSHIRANYILRAMEIPSGEHKIEFMFDPQSLHMTERIAYVAILFWLFSVIAFFAYSYRKKCH